MQCGPEGLGRSLAVTHSELDRIRWDAFCGGNSGIAARIEVDVAPIGDADRKGQLQLYLYR